MKKKVLFIISNFETGGVSKSMTSLMNVIDFDRYDVSLMVVSPHGALMNLLPTNIRLITNPIWEYLACGPEGILKLIRNRNIILAFGHLLRIITSIFSKAKAGLLIARMMPGIEEEFDVVVDYNGQQQLYYMVDKLKAKKKITFFHSDYGKWSYYYAADKKYFPKVDKIFSISGLCVQSLMRFFPEVAGKVELMENISSINLIESLSKEEVEDMNHGTYKLLTVGHVCENKGIYWAIEAAAILKNRNIDFDWYFIGSVNNVSEYLSTCKKYMVEDRIHFLGIRTNPYPYMRKATIIVHPSKFEGRSIALDEAKILCKPIVVTNFSTVNDQFIDRDNASICNMNPTSIANCIEELLTDNNLYNKYCEQLLLSRHDNSSEIKKLYELFNS